MTVPTSSRKLLRRVEVGGPPGRGAPTQMAKPGELRWIGVEVAGGDEEPAAKARGERLDRLARDVHNGDVREGSAASTSASETSTGAWFAAAFRRVSSTAMGS